MKDAKATSAHNPGDGDYETHQATWSDTPSYHDVFVTTEGIERISISDLPFGYELSCNRVGGWCLWGADNGLIAAEYGGAGLRIDVAGHVICDSLPQP